MTMIQLLCELIVICEVTRIHLQEGILDAKGQVDPNMADLVGRMGGSHYVRASGQALFEMPKPISSIGIGVDQLPLKIRENSDLSSSELAILAAVEKIPGEEDLKPENWPLVLKNMLREENFSVHQLIQKNHIWEAFIYLMLN